jgi:leucyl aminopeptidase (aminopeptidase T)
MQDLTKDELITLVRRVFGSQPGDRNLAVICDLPDQELPDNAEWRARRDMAADWAAKLQEGAADLGLEAAGLVMYDNVRRNNAELPERCTIHHSGRETTFGEVLSTHQIVIAPTELSATAPLKLLAKEHHFRAATMPGFGTAMIPALRLDWQEIDRRCHELREKVDRASAAEILMAAAGREFRLTLDLRHRTGTASGGLLNQPGVAGNLPSGETYIVPYEGEREGDPSRTRGELPLDLDGELMVYRIAENRIVTVEGDGPLAAAERNEVETEPAYRNVAELGLGILAGYGIKPVGSLLLDEKLGLHIAFGRSDHFGGQVGPGDFSSPDKVVHIDRVYIPEVQPQVAVLSVDLVGEDGVAAPLMRDGRYV